MRKSKKCLKCKRYKKLSWFYRHGRTKDGHHCYCKECYTKYYDSTMSKRKIYKEYRLKNKEKIKLRNQKRHSDRRLKCLNEYSKGTLKCACCSESNIEFLTIDHINNDGAKHKKEIGSGLLYHWLIKNNFPNNFQVLCYNCNCAKAKNIRNPGVCPHKITD